jgi:signal transduction histidine kinase
MVLSPEGHRQVLWKLADASHQLEAEAEVRRLNREIDDAAERRAAEVEETARQLQRAMDHKNEFLSLMSHELRTPLTVVLGGARFLLSKFDAVANEDRRDILTDMIREGDRLQHLIENLMMLARLDTQEKPELEPLPLQRLLPAVIGEFTTSNPQVTVKTDLSSSLPLALGHAPSVRQVLVNLLTNAMKYGEAGAPIEVRGQTHADEVRIAVHNAGAVLRAEDAEHVFEPFYRSKDVIARKPGAGIGLTVCAMLMEAQGGRIWAESAIKGGGVTFTFALVRSSRGPADPS